MKKTKVIDIFKKPLEEKKADFLSRNKAQVEKNTEILKIKKEKQSKEEKDHLEKTQAEKSEEKRKIEEVFASMPSMENESTMAIKEKETEEIYGADRENEDGEERIDSDDIEPVEVKEKMSWRGYIVCVIILALLGVSGYVIVKILPKVDISIVTKKATWEYGNVITANSKIADIDIASKQIPSAVFYQPKKNLTNLWPATGKKYVEKKAGGNITIYNEFSSSPQVLVIGTRFQAPDGKILKLNNKVTVPGAKVENGKIVASSIVAAVSAEKVGEAYNIDPVSKLTIPGFQGSEKFNKFYGSSQNAMSGGFVGEMSYPTDEDIKKAKVDSEEKIKSAIEGYLYTQIASENFKVIEGTKQFNILSEVVNKETDDSKNFSVFIEAEESMQAFKESYVIDLMTQLAQQNIGGDYKLKDYTIEYGENITNDVKNKSVAMPVTFKGNFWKPVEVNDFKNKTLSKSESDLKALIFSTPAIEKADISFWPFWVSKVPSNIKKVNVIVE